MQKGTELPVHPALARLTRLRQEGNKRRGLGTAELPLISLSDIGINSIDELVQAFDQLDEAIRNGKAEIVWPLIAKLGGGEQLLLDLE